MEQASSSNFICEICKKMFSLKKHLQRHSVEKHGITLLNRLPCPACEENCGTKEKLSQHLEVKHGINKEIEYLNFDCMDNFEKWRTGMQKETNNMYVKEAGARSMKLGYIKHYYICHRSGNFKGRGKGKRTIKSQGSNKIGKICPSYIQVSEKPNEIQVTYCKTHFGHDAEIGCTLLSKSNRSIIAGKKKNDITTMALTVAKLANEVDELDENSLNKITLHLKSIIDIFGKKCNLPMQQPSSSNAKILCQRNFLSTKRKRKFDDLSCSIDTSHISAGLLGLPADNVKMDDPVRHDHVYS